ncbi:MAG: tryptophan-rich sensory protein [Cyanobacteria bacterium J06648_11]
MVSVLAIAGVATAIAVLFNRAFPTDYVWFMRLRRPAWLTFEAAIPFIWIAIFICGIISASIIWQNLEAPAHPWPWMAGYVTVELAILAYMPVMCNLRSLRAGCMLGATGWLFGAMLTVAVWPRSLAAGLLLLPYLLWSPIGTYVTWQMIALNPSERRSGWRD